MKKSQTLKSTLSFIMFAAIFIAMLMMIMDMCVAGESWFIAGNDEGKLAIEWSYAGVYFGLMVVALITWIIRFFACSLPMIKEKHCCFCLMCECAILLGIVIAIVALFLPVGMDVIGSSESEEMYDQARLTAGVVLAWIGLPLAFIASVCKKVHCIQAK